ncbi:MAG: hypothetical protein GY696_13990, partial [Gammaproteobacteria bacterium]|nr:hypothetical protein [Gammaproteobacteria bacterium]
MLALVQKEHLSSMLTKSANDEEHLYVLSSLRKLLRWSRDAVNSRRMFDRDHVRRPDIFPHQLAGLSYYHFKIAVERIAHFASYREILKRTWSQGFAPVLPAFHFRVDPVYSDEGGELTGFDADVNLTLDWLCPGISADAGLGQDFCLGYYEVMLKFLGEKVDRSKLGEDILSLSKEPDSGGVFLWKGDVDLLDVAVRIKEAFIRNRLLIQRGQDSQVDSRSGPVHCTPHSEPYTLTASYANMVPMHYEHSDWEMKVGKHSYGFANPYRPSASIHTDDDIVGELHPCRLTVGHIGTNRY